MAQRYWKRGYWSIERYWNVAKFWFGSTFPETTPSENLIPDTGIIILAPAKLSELYVMAEGEVSTSGVRELTAEPRRELLAAKVLEIYAR